VCVCPKPIRFQLYEIWWYKLSKAVWRTCQG